MSRPDQCPMCGSLNYIALNADGSRYNPFTQPGLWDKCRCDECGHVYSFRIIEIVKTASENGV
jgi:uncharacterized Zn finger protein